MAKNNHSSKPAVRLGGKKHEHPILPLEYGHPVTVSDDDIPEGLTTENVAVIDVPRTRFRSLSGNDFPIGDWTDAFGRLRDRYGDCFDLVVFFTDPRLPSIPYSGYHRGVFNEVSGIGRGMFDSRQTWGSDRLQSQVWMGRFSLGTLLQEIGHRWGVFVDYRLTRNGASQSDLMLPSGGHWARPFDDGSSPMDYDEERHLRQTATTWLREPIGGFEFVYSRLDLYLMGLMPRQQVGSFTLIRNYSPVGPALPGGRQLINGSARTLGVTNVLWAEGRRVPSSSQSQQQFRAAFVVVTRDDTRLDPTFVKKVEVLRRQAEAYFGVATLGRGCLDTQLCCGAPPTRSGELSMRLRRDRITRSPFVYHGLGPVPARVELGLESTIGGRPIVSWSREETPDIAAGVQHLEAQVNRSPYDGRFQIVAQAKGADLTIPVKWSAISFN